MRTWFTFHSKEMTKHKCLKMMESRAHKDIFTFSSKQCFMELLRNAAKHRGMEENRNCWSEPKTNSLVGHHIPPKMFHLQLIFLRQVAHKVHRNVSIYLTYLPVCLSVYKIYWHITCTLSQAGWSTQYGASGWVLPALALDKQLLLALLTTLWDEPLLAPAHTALNLVFPLQVWNTRWPPSLCLTQTSF